MDRNSRLPALTGLRWAAAVVVFGQHLLERYFDPHLQAPQQLRSVLWAVLVNGGALGVSFFFVLSGFVLTWSTRPGEGAGAFWWRRITKIYPATLVTTLAAVAIVGMAGPLQLATHLTLTHSWLPRADVYGALNPVSWSLSVEAFFYLCFPLLLPLLRRLRTPALWGVAVLMVEFVAAVAVDLIPFGHDTALFVAYLLPPVRMAEFTLGIVIALLVRRGTWRGPGLGWSFALLLPAYAGNLFLPYPANQQALTLIPVAFVIAAAARADLRGERSLWSRPLMVYLGQLSFGFYLVHYLVFVAFERFGLLPQPVGPAAAALATASVFSFSLIAAMGVYHWVELPALELLRRRRPGRHRAGSMVIPPQRALVAGPDGAPISPAPAQPVSPSMR
ncbi:acyltransferase family protein [Dactylosporangium sucinum]|uniref:Acyltransferase n=1 Tax=Dactylosporangium sucinum TaxID=1424081 RepID=A0A917UD14_9ACTN|nr:acyltransferase [Dactylosporangium sucinum]GGM71504.1 acyltransferase [Dactylosporangium sucinum]